MKVMRADHPSDTSCLQISFVWISLYHKNARKEQYGEDNRLNVVQWVTGLTSPTFRIDQCDHLRAILGCAS